MRSLALLCALLFLPITAAADYNGPDGGWLIYSAGAIEVGGPVTFHFKRVARPDGTRVSDTQRAIHCRCVGFWRGKPSDADYDGREVGKVIARRLPPGRYEVYNYYFSGSGPAATSTTSKKKFAIPFEIRAGETTYIGNFARANTYRTTLMKTLGTSSFFVISDKSERDVAIARKRNPHLPPVRNEVFDVSTLDHPRLHAKEPERWGEMPNP